MGSMLEFCGADGRVDLRIHLSGDTLMDHRCLSGIPRRFPDIDLGIVHLGGTRILGMLVTMDGEQGARWVNLINPRTVMPVHYDDYTVFTSSLDDFRRHVERVGWADRVRYVARGESLHLPTRHGADIFRTPEMGRPS